jgi:PKD repeat protein
MKKTINLTFAHGIILLISGILFTSSFALKAQSCNANFTYTVGGSANKTVNFTSASNDTLAQHVWYFGDGTTSALINPVKTYLNYGAKTIIHLVKKGNICADTFVTTVTLNNSIPCNANFTYTVGGSANKTVNFTSASNDTLAQHVWYFGDGTTSALINPVKTYLNYGAKTIIHLVKKGNICADTFVTTVTLNNSIPCNANFTYTVGGSANKTVNFTSASNDTLAQHVWYFGDGTTSALINPVKTYLNYGAKTIIHLVKKGNICADTFVTTVTLNNSIPCNANFTYTVGGSANKTVNFTSASNDTLAQHVWYFGDGTTSALINPVKTYLNYGAKTIIHLVKKGNICADTFVTTVTLNNSIPCNANFTYTVGGSANKTVNFTSASNDTLAQHVWYFGDGTTSALINPVKTYLNYGAKTIIHLVKKGNICADTFVTTVTLNNSIPCNANFTYTVGGSANKTVNFTSASNDTLAQHVWYFGDGTTSALINPVKTYLNYGAKTIIHLVKKGNICADTFVTTVTLNNSIPCNANFTYTVGGSANKTVNFTSASNDTLAQHVWYFGDGTTSALINPVKTYLNYGAKTIIHLVKKGNICADTFVTTVTLNNSIPCNANFTYTVGGSANKTVNFTSASNDTLAQHVWYFGDGTTSALINPVKTYLNYGAKTIIHLVKKGNICADTFVTTVTLNNSIPCNANFTYTVGGSANKTVNFTSASNDTLAQHVWYFGDGTTSALINPVKTYLNYGAKTIIHLVKKGNICADTFVTTVTLNNSIPVTNIKNQEAIKLSAIYPIPANDEINLDLNSLLAQEINFVIIDMTGKVCLNKVYKTTIGQNNIKLDISNLLAGFYVVQIDTPQGKIIQKIIK